MRNRRIVYVEIDVRKAKNTRKTTKHLLKSEEGGHVPLNECGSDLSLAPLTADGVPGENAFRGVLCRAKKNLFEGNAMFAGWQP